MKQFILFLILLNFLLICNAGNSPYPIIFVHGLTGDDTSFKDTMFKLNSKFDIDEDDINVLDICLNKDNNNATADMNNDIEYDNFQYITLLHNYDVVLGRRNYSENYLECTHAWAANRSVYAINFNENRFEGASWDLITQFDGSNQSAIMKQGKALGHMINEVLEYTGAEKVILVGHSMGGLAIREYLQRTEIVDGVTKNKWWVDKNDSLNGHKVARVVTIGTPHLGSNFLGVFSKDETPNVWSEGSRDMRYDYDGIGSVAPSESSNNGVYLFGGDETTPALMINNFCNDDIDCNGSINEGIIGLNDPLTFSFNNNMALPSNLEYTWIVSKVEGLLDLLADSDGIVRADRQMLYNFGDTLMTHVAHTSEGKNYQSIFRGLDEPDNLQFSYLVESSKWYSGFITYQPNMGIEDKDCYFLRTNGDCQIDLQFYTNNTGVNQLEVLKKNSANNYDTLHTYNLLEGVNNYTFASNGNSEVYFRITGNASNTSTDHTYDFYFTTTDVQLEADFQCNLTYGTISTMFSFQDLSQVQGTSITSYQWDFNNDGIVDSYVANPTWQYPNYGIYSVRLTISDGIHLDYIVKTNCIVVRPQSSDTQYNISSLEYFFDIDPGIGNGNPIYCSQDYEVTTEVSIPTTGLFEGLHRLYVRAKDENNQWGVPQCKPIIIQNTSTSEPLHQITQMEYYFDNAVAPGSGTSISVSAGEDILKSISVPTGSLTEGLHRLYVRAKDENNQWGVPQVKPIIIQNTSTSEPAHQITQMEFYFDDGVVPGNGTSINVSAGEDILKSISVPTGNLTEGLHRLYVRARDENNQWGVPQVKPIIIQNTSATEPLATLSGIEYFFDTDPGVGNATYYALPDTSSEATVSLSIPVDELSLGEHVFYLRAKDSLNRWGIPQAIIITLALMPNIVVSENNYDIVSTPGEPVQKTLTISNTGEADLSWSINFNSSNPSLAIRVRDSRKIKLPEVSLARSNKSKRLTERENQPEWLAMSEITGVLTPNQTEDVVLTFDSSIVGDFTTLMQISSNDMNHSVISLPLQYQVITGLESPTGVQISFVGNSLNLQWNSVAVAQSYKVFASDSPNGVFTDITDMGNLELSEPIIWTVPLTATLPKFFYVKASTDAVISVSKSRRMSANQSREGN